MSTNQAKKVAVLMSGGVDSSLAAALLHRQGHQVLGITLKLLNEHAPPRWDAAFRAAVGDARQVARKIGIDHDVLDIADVFAERIVKPFEQSYRRGQTPNPCIQCNQLIKFGLTLERVQHLGIDLLASGHYARLEGDPTAFHLKRGVDSGKDQSYFLYAVGRKNLSKTLFPVGQLHKSESRRLAAEFKLPIAEKPESQDICFIAGKDYRSCLSPLPRPGLLKDCAGRVLGHHSGIEQFTIGQRKGIGLSGGPYYVLHIEPETNTVIVGPRQQGYRSCLEASQAVWLERIQVGQPVEVQIRSRHVPTPAVIESASEERFRLRFQEPQWAITPGQSAVLYNSDLVLGGGIIQSSH